MLLNDLRYAARTMRRTPVFATAVILTIALAIGANTAVFSVVNTVLIRPLPFAKPERLIQVGEKNDKLKLTNFGASVLNFIAWREKTQSFTELAALGYGTFTISGSGGDAEQLTGNRISPALTRVLGVAPIAGREFTQDEEKPGAAAVVLISEGLWKRRFGSDPRLIGRTITVNAAPATVVGVVPAALTLFSGSDIFTPLVIDPAKEIRLNHVITVFGRVKPGVSIEQAQAEMDTISSQLGKDYPEIKDWGIHLITMFDTFVPAQLETALLVLLGAVGCVLLIACSNIANLLLARAAARQKEMAVRRAIGASGGRLLRQLLVESLMLSVTGGAIGLAGAIGAVSVVNRVLPQNLLPIPAVTVDARVLLFGLGVTIISGLLFGIAPAWRTARVDMNEVLKLGGRESAGTVRSRLRNTLAAVEIALATVLLIGAGLLIQSLSKLKNVQLGFQPRGLITFQLAPPLTKYPLNDKASLLYRGLLDSLRSIPGVRTAAASSGIPFGAGNYNISPVASSGSSVLAPDASVPIDWRIVSPEYFKAMNIPLLRGRDFTDADGPPPANPVMIISKATAKTFWGDADPIGRMLHRVADPKTSFTIVGVVGDVRSRALNEETRTLYYSLAWRVSGLMDVVVRTEGAPEALLPAIRQKIREIDSDLALANVRTMDEWISNSAAQPRLNAMLLGVFSAIALLIAAIGIYGVLAYSANQRTREIGLRMALGAQPGNILRLIVGEGMRFALIGVGVGLLCSIGFGRAVSTLVYGVSVHDPATFAGVAILLTGVALAACVFPARRAAQVDPMIALRHE
ncbi:MAG TPA: ABC transporter permease [Candidatus Angelobacter sp.]